MDDKHRYDINLRQGDLRISLSSDDVYFISKQMDKWFKVLLDDSYVPISIPPGLGGVVQADKPVRIPEVVPAAPPPVQLVQEMVPPSPEPPPVPVIEPVAPPPVVEVPAPPPVIPPVETPVASAPVATPPVQEPPLPPPVPEPVVPSAPEPIVGQASESAYEPTLADVLEPAVVPQPEFVRPSGPEPEAPAARALPEPVAEAPPLQAAQPAKVLADTVEDDFEAVMDSLMKDLGEPSDDLPISPQRPLPAETLPGREPVYEKVSEPPVEEYAFPQGMRNNQDNGNGHSAGRVDFEMINSLSELCDKSRAATSEDYLLLSAFYITCFEGIEKFSLKRINSMLVKSGLTPVNHSVLESALTQGHLSMVQDMTGMAEATEYTMTDNGMDAAHQLL